MESCVAYEMRRFLLAGLAGLAAVGAGALAQGTPKAVNLTQPQHGQWVPPGTPGSSIDGEIFHAQVLLDVAGFPAGVIDGKKGMSFKKAVQGFQESLGLEQTGELDTPTRQALLQVGRQSTRMLALGPEVFDGPFVYPFPKKAEAQAKLGFLGYRNPLEKLAEMFHTTPDTIVALNGPDKFMRQGEVLRLPNVLPVSRSYGDKLKPEYAKWFNALNVDADEPAGDHVVVDKSEGVLKVMDQSERLIAQFPVTMGSEHDPLPLGTWKATTYSFLPPFHYQPELFWDVADEKDEQRLPPGPNGPVGVAWLDLSKENYGIHGTGAPETIGRAESHGCIRMTNWDVLRLSRIMKPGFSAVFQA
jgi:L,D-transpeptidase catalytic domain/Putative peptidoglycan binding domain